MPTAVSLANNALILIGDEGISSFDEPGAGAKAAASLYQSTYEMIIACHPWSFAFCERRLSQLVERPPEDTYWEYSYQMPPDLLRLWRVIPWSDYLILGHELRSNYHELWAQYTTLVDESILPPTLAKAIEYKLAAEFAGLVTESDQKSQLFEQKYNETISAAKTIDSQNRPQTGIVDSPFTQVRYTGYSGFRHGRY